MKSFDVRLNIEATPVFPRRCIYSNEINPDAYIKITEEKGSFMGLSLFKRPSVYKVPILKKFIFRMKFERFIRLFVFILCIGCILLFLSEFELISLDSWIEVKIVTLPLLILFAFWELYKPRLLVITKHRKTVEFEFRDHCYGEQFRLLNKSKIFNG